MHVKSPVGRVALPAGEDRDGRRFLLEGVAAGRTSCRAAGSDGCTRITAQARHPASLKPVTDIQPARGVFSDPVVPDTDPARPRALAWEQYSDRVLCATYLLLWQEPEEAEVQRFLELHPSMIPGGSGDIGPGGHHRSDMGAVFRQPDLIGAGRAFQPDFMWVTRSTSLVTPILVEIEKPSKRWFRRDGRPTSKAAALGTVSWAEGPGVVDAILLRDGPM